MRSVVEGLAAGCVAVVFGLGNVQAATAKATPLPPPNSEVRIDYTFDDPARADNFLTISRQIVAAFETKVAPEPYLGRRPLVEDLAAALGVPIER